MAVGSPGDVENRSFLDDGHRQVAGVGVGHHDDDGEGVHAADGGGEDAGGGVVAVADVGNDVVEDEGGVVSEADPVVGFVP